MLDSGYWGTGSDVLGVRTRPEILGVRWGQTVASACALCLPTNLVEYLNRTEFRTSGLSLRLAFTEEHRGSDARSSVLEVSFRVYSQDSKMRSSGWVCRLCKLCAII